MAISKLKLISQAVKDRACAIIQAATDDPIIEVEFREYKKDCSAAQGRLKWMWMTDIATANGEEKEDVNHRYKRKFLLHIYERDNQQYAEMIASVRNVYRAGLVEDAERLLEGIVRETRTASGTTKQISEYLGEVERDAVACGITLRYPEDIYREAMGP